MFSRTYMIGVVLVLLAAAVAVAGCAAAVAPVAAGMRMASKDSITHKPEYEIGGKPIMVIPFKDEVHMYYESPDGVELATAVVGELLRRGAATNVKSDDEIRTMFAGQDLDKMGWSKIGKQAGVHLILAGHIQRFALRDPKTIGMLRGNCKVNWAIYDVAKGVPVHSVRGLEVFVPEYGAGVAESDTDPERLRAALLASTALKIVQSYYTWQEKIGPPLPRY